jgi:hypothetical protein
MISCSSLRSSRTLSSKKASSGTISANPNPIQVCDASGLGVTKLSWDSVGPNRVEVRLSSPDGVLFAQTVPTGTAETGKWVADGMTFYLQDVSAGKPLTAENTLATTTVKVTTTGCP